MPDLIDVHIVDNATPVLAVAQYARGQIMEALQSRPSESAVGGWDYDATRGTNVKSFERGNIGIIEINGLLWTHDDMRAYFYGMTTYESVSMELGRMIASESIDGVVLSINSPGGLVSGCDELAEAIYAARDELPLGIHTHGMGQAESGGYWLGSAANSMTINPTSMIGSVGAMLGVYKKLKNEKTVQFYSSVSPLKQADPETPEGRSEYQRAVDATGDVFVAAVARYRGVSVEKVASDFGRGGSLVGQEAISAGMADAVGSLEDVISILRSGNIGSQSTGGIQMAVHKGNNATVTPQGTPAPAPQAAATPPNVPVVQEPVADNSVEAVKAERARVSSIITALQGTGMEEKASEYIASGADVASVNADIVAHMKANKPQAQAIQPTQAGSVHSGTLDAMRRESGSVQNVGSGNPGGGDSDEEKKKQELKAYNDAWASSAKSVIARGATRRVNA